MSAKHETIRLSITKYYKKDDVNMDQNKMIEDLVAMLDSGMSKGVGHINADVRDDIEGTKEVQTMGCSDCSRTPLACSVPTLHQGLDDYS